MVLLSFFCFIFYIYFYATHSIVARPPSVEVHKTNYTIVLSLCDRTRPKAEYHFYIFVWTPPVTPSNQPVVCVCVCVCVSIRMCICEYRLLLSSSATRCHFCLCRSALQPPNDL